MSLSQVHFVLTLCVWRAAQLIIHCQNYNITKSIHPPVSFLSSEVRQQWQEANRNIPDITLPWDTLLLLPGEPEAFKARWDL